MKAGQILFVISTFFMLSIGIPSLLNFLNIDVAQYYTPFQIFALAYCVLFVFLPKKVSNPFA